jgi:hypothetical protein
MVYQYFEYEDINAKAVAVTFDPGSYLTVWLSIAITSGKE